MNSYILDNSLLEEFKQALSDHDDFLINTYSNYNGKNLWSLICSAKDWLSVSVNGLPYIDLTHAHDDFRSLNVLQLIMTYDIVLQSIEQLLRVFEMEYTLKNDSSVFNAAIPDDAYFAQIRACFGAHPVDLRIADGTKTTNKYFASWSSDISNSGDNGDYSVFLYSNNPNVVQPISFSMSFANIHEFIVKRYSLLTSMISVIKKKNGIFIEDQRLQEIGHSSDVVEQLQILIRENSIRIGEGEGYHYDIQTLIELFTAPQEFPERERQEADQYLNSLHLLVNELYDALQSMTFSENAVTQGHLIHSRSPKFKGLNYDLEKVFEYLNNPYFRADRVDYHLRRLISEGLLPSYVSRQTDKLDLHLLLLARLTVNEKKH
ncbi:MULTISPECIES: hypothetical protein [Paenibacillus]|uniref:Uncharacterized protein n=1 Tax=Paenibacillus amylolyticus TaxID=1451 RepID=A0A1R1C0H2_PAEAM|nr:MULTISPECIES: hypothetical protein [Paenibacillus]OMF15498.1 hypothetical protein BK131_11580 [Paenibacillus amylolyticus]PRA07889.1 hypothetical protein CQ043_11135 [Paenibacillus sp. MYb63]PRA48034.1 hypothetical protein CQ061_15695 [Paenibacillus sp. MYb67]